MSITLEERVAILEAEISLIKNKVESPTVTVKPWWEQITGQYLPTAQTMTKPCN